MEQITVDATFENIEKITSFINEKIANYNCSDKVRVQIDIVIDELIGNIVKYGYKDKVGSVTVQAYVEENPTTLNITIIDSGIPYNPLMHKTPDITLSAEERKFGGLGIHVTRKLMDDMSYEYVDGQNVLKIKKILK